jgi:acylpyruvate hydrolase
MRLVSYSIKSIARLGAVLDGYVVDIKRALQFFGSNETEVTYLGDVYQNMMSLLQAGDDAWRVLHDTFQLASESYLNITEDLVHQEILIPNQKVKFSTPLPTPGKVICIAGNYPSHENNQKPDYPTVFLKPSSTITGPGMPVFLSDITQDVVVEVELGLVINRKTRHVSEKDALSSIAGYFLANDIGDRLLEKRSSQWTSGKMFDTFTPIGPWIVTKDEFPSTKNLEMTTLLNGIVIQKGNTSDMFFNVEEVISYLSDLTTLQPGDIILTGSPKLIGKNPNPSVTLSEGDTIAIKIDGLGELVNPVQKE